MSIFLRHKASTAFLAVYALWWILVLYILFFSRRNAAPSCDFSTPVLFIGTILIGGGFSLALIVKYVISKGSAKKDYLIFLAIVILPVLLLFFAFYMV